MLLTTQRLLLREFRPEDVTAVFAFMRDPNAIYDAQRTAEALRKIGIHIESAIHGAHQVARRDYYLAVVLRETHQLIGGLNLVIAETDLHEAELGFHLNPDFTGQGYATEASRALLAWSFQELGLQRVYATCAADNLASQRVLTKIGMRLEGRQPAEEMHPPSEQDVLLYALENLDRTTAF